MNDTVTALADQYDEAQKAGRTVITKAWASLGESTRAWLVKSGHYAEHGSPLSVEYGETEELVSDLEYNVGTLKLCADVKLPIRTEKGASISEHALKMEVSQALSFLMYHPHGREPRFLRLALYALRQNQMANLLTTLPAPKASPKLLGGIGQMALAILNVLLLLASPLVLASALTSATAGNAGDTAMALYGLGFVAWIYIITKDLAKQHDGSNLGTKDEQTYNAWEQLNSYVSGDWTAAGAGAQAYFEDMLRRGLRIPPVAFDIAAALKESTLRYSADANLR